MEVRVFSPTPMTPGAPPLGVIVSLGPMWAIPCETSAQNGATTLPAGPGSSYSPRCSAVGFQSERNLPLGRFWQCGPQTYRPYGPQAPPIQVSRLHETGARPEPPENPDRLTVRMGRYPLSGKVSELEPGEHLDMWRKISLQQMSTTAIFPGTGEPVARRAWTMEQDDKLVVTIVGGGASSTLRPSLPSRWV